MGFLSEAAAESSNDEPVTAESGESTDNSTAQVDTTPSNKPEGAPVKLGRREQQRQNQDKLTATIAELTNKFGESQKSWETKFSQIAEENARQRGAFETLINQSRQSQIQQAQVPNQPKKSPDELMRQAREAIDAGKFDDYQTLMRDSLLESVRGMIPQQQAPAQETVNPMVLAMMSQFPAVVNAGEKGRRLAIAHDNLLNEMGIPDGPDRYRRAFEMASNSLGGQQPQQQQFSQASRGALGGVPSNRNGAGGGAGEPGIVLTAWEREVARRCGMTPEEYANYQAEAHPERVKNA